MLQKIKSILSLISKCIKEPVGDKKRFIEANSRYWAHLLRKAGDGKREGVVLVEGVTYPILMLSNSSFATIASNALNCSVCWILETPLHYFSEKPFFSSYPNSRVVFNRKWFAAPFRQICSALQTFWAYKTLKKPSDILDLHIDKVRIGDLVYDALLSQFKLATVSKIDIRVFYTIFQAYYNYHCINKVFSNLNVKALVVSHYVGIKSGIY